MGADRTPNPRVSVYIPTHNRASMLERAIRSVERQTFRDFDIVVADDASTDATPNLLETLGREFGNIHVVRSDTPQGACEMRNRAIEAARGRYVTGLDDDDEFLPTRLQVLLGGHVDSASFTCCRELVQHGSGRRLESPMHGRVTLDRLLHYNVVGNQVLVERARVLEVGGFDRAFPALQDYDLWVRLVARYGDAQKLSDATYVRHAEHEGRISESSTRRLRALEMFVEKHARLMNGRHRASMELLRKKVAGERLTLTEFVRLCNTDNAVPASLQLLNSGPDWLLAAKDFVARLAARGPLGQRSREGDES